jgi:hypothetical protein
LWAIRVPCIEVVAPRDTAPSATQNTLQADAPFANITELLAPV